MESEEAFSWRRNARGRAQRSGQPPRYRRGPRRFNAGPSNESTDKVIIDHTGKKSEPRSIEPGRSRKQAWSNLVWSEGAGTESERVRSNSIANSGGNSNPSNQAIGLGRATGLSRVPDSSLANSPELVRQRLDNVLAQSKKLEADGVVLVNASCESSGHNSTASQNALEVWEPILAEFRKLTMSITASSNAGVQGMGLEVYEAAADACLLAGNLSFYLSCQTRLMELFAEYASDDEVCKRKLEFTSYALLYFGIFCVDQVEVTLLMRSMTKRDMKSSHVQFALSAIIAFRARNGPNFISIFQRGNLRQKTILSTGLDAMRKHALEQMICAYMTLDMSYAWSLLGADASTDFLALLRDVRPDLADINSNGVDYKFRAPRKTQ